MTAKLLHIVCEGPSESRFVSDLLAPHFGSLGVTARPQVVPTSRGSKGGGSPSKWIPYLKKLVKQASDSRSKGTFTVVSTLYDYYPSRMWVEYLPTTPPSDAHARVATIESELTRVVAPNAVPGLFVPHLQLHEFEAMVLVDLLADEAELTRLPYSSPSSTTLGALRDHVRKVRPERVNDHPESAPSKRILQLVPEYKKASDGPIVVERIGLTRVRAACPHLHQWLLALEALFGVPQTN